MGRAKRLHAALHRNRAMALATKAVVAVVGTAVVLVGVVLSGPGIPGPGFVVILAGLALLATEFDWARRLMHWLKERAERMAERARRTDPRVRRRRLLIAGVVILVLAAVALWYLLTYDWPRFAISGWDAVQRIAGWVPELPGM